MTDPVARDIDELVTDRHIAGLRERGYTVIEPSESEPCPMCEGSGRAQWSGRGWAPAAGVLPPGDVPDLSDIVDEIRPAISNAYYDARNTGETMEDAASRAAGAVLAILQDSPTLRVLSPSPEVSAPEATLARKVLRDLIYASYTPDRGRLILDRHVTPDEWDAIVAFLDGAASSPAAPGLREALDSAVEEFDNILWEDIWRSLSDHGDAELARWSRKYVAYLRDDIDKARAALAETPGEPE